MMLKRYFWFILVSFDQLVNTLLAGDPDETLSSRMGKYVQRGRGWLPCQLCKMLDWLFRDKDHCINSVEADEGEK